MKIKSPVASLASLPSAAVNLFRRTVQAVSPSGYRPVAQVIDITEDPDLELGLWPTHQDNTASSSGATPPPPGSSAPQSFLERLPPELLGNVLSFLQLEESKNVADTSHSLRTHIEELPLWDQTETNIGRLPLDFNAVRLGLNATSQTEEDQLFLQYERKLMTRAAGVGVAFSLTYLVGAGIIRLNKHSPVYAQLFYPRPISSGAPQFKLPSPPSGYNPIALNITQTLCDTLGEPQKNTSFTRDGCIADMRFQHNLAEIIRENAVMSARYAAEKAAHALALANYEAAVAHRNIQIPTDTAHMEQWVHNFNLSLLGAIAGVVLPAAFMIGLYLHHRSTKVVQVAAEETPGLRRRRLIKQKKVALALGNRMSKAARLGDIASLTRLLAETTSAFKLDETPSTPQKLDSSESIPDAAQTPVGTALTDSQGHTPLHVALQANQVEASRLLLEAGYKCDSTALDHAMLQTDNHAMVEMLLTTAELQVQPWYWDAAIGRNDAQLFTILTQHTENPATVRALLAQTFGRDAKTYLAAAIEADTQGGALVQLLIDHGADVNQASGLHQFTPLQIAINKRNEFVTLALMTAGADPDQRDKFSNNSATTLAIHAGEPFTSLLKST